MGEASADIKADVSAVIDRGEKPSLMEPLLIGETSPRRAELTDLAIDLAARSAGLRRSLPEGVRMALADLVRITSSYHSNLIEGHETHPFDIERALNDDHSADSRQRALQLEARAYVSVQQWIDSGGLAGRAATRAGIREIHQRLCTLMPEELLWVETRRTGERVKVTPGRLRARDIRVAQGSPISPGAVPRFLAHFERAYGRLGRTDSILSSAAAHHRLLWIHPFADGNGRVARLMSHAILLEVLDTDGLWSIARGLARNVASYQGHLANCDVQCRSTLDERDASSEDALAGFTRFFLQTSIDEVSVMEGLVQPERLRARVLLWTEEEIRLGHLPPKSGNVLEAVLYRGELPRGDAANIVGTGDRQARRIVSALLDKGVLTSESPRAPLRLTFTAAVAPRWLPGLFPDVIRRPESSQPADRRPRGSEA